METEVQEHLKQEAALEAKLQDEILKAAEQINEEKERAAEKIK